MKSIINYINESQNNIYYTYAIKSGGWGRGFCKNISDARRIVGDSNYYEIYNNNNSTANPERDELIEWHGTGGYISNLVDNTFKWGEKLSQPEINKLRKKEVK